jgi:hypothetical protein
MMLWSAAPGSHACMMSPKAHRAAMTPTDVEAASNSPPPRMARLLIRSSLQARAHQLDDHQEGHILRWGRCGSSRAFIRPTALTI